MNNLTWTITLDQQTGQIQLNGPVENLLLVYGIVERVKDMVREIAAHPQPNAGKLVVPRTVPPPFPMKLNGS